jgi:hypothetical protein
MLKELLPKSRLYKVVCTNDRNDDQDLFGFYPNARKAAQAIPALEKRYGDWIKRCNGQLIVKPTYPEMIFNPVCTDYEHFNRALIPDDEWKRVMDSDAAAEICCNSMTCGRGYYYKLAQMIDKKWTVIDIGASYGAQSYLFQDHAKYIAVEPFESSDDWHFENFKADGTERYEMTAGNFIKDILPTLNLDLKKTFAICNYVPEWFGEKPMELIRHTFHNCFVYYP